MPRRPRLLDRLAGRRRIDPAAEIDAVAAVTERLAVLLAAGVPAPGAWSNVGADGASGADAEVLEIAASAARRGEPVAPAIADSLPERPTASAACPSPSRR